MSNDILKDSYRLNINEATTSISPKNILISILGSDAKSILTDTKEQDRVLDLIVTLIG